MHFSIKPAGKNDSKLLADLGAVCFSEAFGKDNPEDDLKIYLEEAFNIEKIKNELSDKNISYVVAYDEREAIGYAKLHREEIPPELDGKAMHLERIYVRQKAKEKKVGAALMQKCLDVAKSENCKYLWLAVWQENKSAIDFYIKWGFEICGFREFRIGNKIDEDFMMRKAIV